MTFDIDLGTVAVADLKRLSKIASSLQYENGEFILSTDGSTWEALVAETGHVAMSAVHFKPIEAPAVEGKLGIHIGRFAKLLSGLKATEVEMGVKDGHLVIKSGRSKRTTALLAPEHIAEKKMPTLSPPCQVDLEDISDLVDAIKAAGGVASRMKFVAGEHGLEVSSTADESHVQFSNTEDIIEGHVEGSATSVYSTDFATKVLPIYSGPATLRFDNDHPLVIDCGNDTYLQAPIVEVD